MMTKISDSDVPGEHGDVGKTLALHPVKIINFRQ